MGVTVIGLAIAIPFIALEVYYAGTYVRAHQSKSACKRERSKKKWMSIEWMKNWQQQSVF